MWANKIAYYIIVNIVVLAVALLSTYTYTEILAFTTLVLLVDVSVYVYYQNVVINTILQMLKEKGVNSVSSNNTEDKQ